MSLELRLLAYQGGGTRGDRIVKASFRGKYFFIINQLFTVDLQPYLVTKFGYFYYETLFLYQRYTLSSELKFRLATSSCNNKSKIYKFLSLYMIYQSNSRHMSLQPYLQLFDRLLMFVFFVLGASHFSKSFEDRGEWSNIREVSI